MITIRLVPCLLLLASIAISAFSTDNEWLASVLFVGQIPSNGQSVTPTTAIQPLPAPRPVFTTTTTQTRTDTKVVISAATIPSAEGTLTHPFSSSTSSMSRPFPSSSSSSHSSAAAPLPVGLISATFVVAILGSMLAALF
ncbi:hypothetical protein GGI13_006978 [Coemansia sp. RSA 455]|nr:hypothetical protein GGI13_006978 [Coemansia sp. RSA 455]